MRKVMVTERLTLRPLELHDAESMEKLAGEKEVADTTLNIIDICTKYEFCEKAPKKRPDDGQFFYFYIFTLLHHLSILLTAFLISSSVKCV